jgi:hypothetical protein
MYSFIQRFKQNPLQEVEKDAVSIAKAFRTRNVAERVYIIKLLQLQLVEDILEEKEVAESNLKNYRDFILDIKEEL